jgi:hypothetical protein
MSKRKKKKPGKAKKPVKELRPKPSDPELLKEEDRVEDFGGMDLANFRKNLGCG